MSGTGNGRPTEGLAGLNRTLCEIREAEPNHRAELVAEFVMHPVSQTKLRAACGSVLKRQASRHDLVADISQQAALLVTQRLNSATLPYEQRPLPQFGGWVWRLWLTSCQQAWREYRQQIKRTRLLHETDMIDRSVVDQSSPIDSWELWHDIQLAVGQLEHPLQRTLMFDWMGGLNGYESAELRGMAPSTVFRHRRQAVKSLRCQLSRNEI